MRTFVIWLAVLVATSPVLAQDGDGQKGGRVASPRVVKSVPPDYTAEAIRARIEGVVVLTAVVQADGRVDEVKVTRSLDSEFGLDEQAVIALKKWEFEPGTMNGKPVAVRIHAELSFNLRQRREESQQK